MANVAMNLSRTFSNDDQQAFAALSGDRNPMHVDAAAARRLMFGRPVVHGIHLALWALEQALEDKPERIALKRIRFAFARPLGVGEQATLRLINVKPDSADLHLHDAGGVLAKLRFSWEPAATGSQAAPQPAEPAILRDREFAELETAEGTVPLGIDPALAAQLFPGLSSKLGGTQLTVILGTTRLVGMECPGLHSVYSELQLRFSETGDAPGAMNYKVTDLHSVFRCMTMEIGGTGFHGEITAFVRHAPQSQPTTESLRPRVVPGEFAGEQALVIGGSRGLGEITAKLLALGGANVCITYRSGAAEAFAVVADIQAAGGTAQAVAFDVLNPDWSHIEPQTSPTLLCDFSTPFIFAGTEGNFRADLFARFCEFYVSGFARLVDQWASKGLKRALYPSTSALDTLPGGMAEYAAAKAAGEVLCATLEQRHAGLRIHRPRLPRMNTDQTATFSVVPSQDAGTELLARLRELRAL